MLPHWNNHYCGFELYYLLQILIYCELRPKVMTDFGFTIMVSWEIWLS